MKYKIRDRFFYIAIVSILIGIISLILPKSFVSSFYKYVVGITIILIGFYKLIISDINALGKKEFYIDIAEGFISIIVGVVVMNFYHNYHTCLLLGIIYLIIPMYRIFISSNKLNQLIIDIFKFLFAGVMIFNTRKIPFLFQIYISLIYLAFGISIIVYKHIKYKRLKSSSEV